MHPNYDEFDVQIDPSSMDDLDGMQPLAIVPVSSTEVVVGEGNDDTLDQSME